MVHTELKDKLNSNLLTITKQNTPINKHIKNPIILCLLD